MLMPPQRTLGPGFYDAIALELSSGDDAAGVFEAVSQSPWGTKFDGGSSVSGGCFLTGRLN